MGVKALDAGTRAPDAPVWPRSGVVGRKGGVALARVRIVRCSQRGRVNVSHCSAYAARRLELRYTSAFGLAHQPVASRHRRAVVEDGRVADDDGRPVLVAHDDLVGAARNTAEQDGDRGVIVAREVRHR